MSKSAEKQSNPKADLQALQKNWLDKINLKYTPMRDDIYDQTRPSRLSELLCALDHHYCQQPDELNIGRGQKLTFGIIPINKTHDGVSIQTHVAATVVGVDDEASVLLVTADDSDRLEQYKQEHEIEANSAEFKRDELFIILATLAKEHGLSPEQVKYINYTAPNLSEQANMHRQKDARNYLRTLYKAKQGWGSYSTLYSDDMEYLLQTLNSTKVRGLALSESEKQTINNSLSLKTNDEPVINEEFEHKGHTYDFDIGINKIAFSRELTQTLISEQARYQKAIEDVVPDVDKNDNVRITCGDHRVTIRTRWHEPKQVLDELHKAGLENVTIEDITETITTSKKVIDNKKLEQALFDKGFDVTLKESKKASFSVVKATNTKEYKARHADEVEANIKAVIEGVNNKLEMYEPGDEEVNAADTAAEAGYGVKL